MTSDYTSDLQNVLDNLERSRQTLRGLIDSLQPEDLGRGSRGEWTVGAVLRHVLRSEPHYRSLVGRLRSRDDPPSARAPDAAESISEIAAGLESEWQRMREAVDGVDEETFYRLQDTGHQEYSVRSVLADNARHNREHVEQIQTILKVI
jgi:uncharacterized damage-inducible protein DinB